MVRLKATIICIYDANPEHYGTDNPEEMAKIDQDQCLEELIEGKLASFTVTPVKEEE